MSAPSLVREGGFARIMVKRKLTLCASVPCHSVIV